MSNPRSFPDELHALFTQIDPLALQQFAQAHQHWTTLQRIAKLEKQVTSLQEELAENDMQLKWIQPSAIAIAAIVRFQAYGVDDINLLDTMLERGETWLDQTLQLLEQCERLGLIGDSYTVWCEHALEGAYDWIASMHSSGEDAEPVAAEVVEQVQQNGHQQLSPEITEEMLIQRLMSEDETEKLATLVSSPTDSEQDAAAVASPPTFDVAEVQDEPAYIEVISTAEPINEHKEAAIETLEPAAETLATSEIAQEHITVYETFAAPEPREVSDPPLAASDSLVEALTAPELFDAASPSVETSAASEPIETSETPVEPSDIPESLETSDAAIETLATPELLEDSDLSIETLVAFEASEGSDTSAEALDSLEGSNEAPEEIIQAVAVTTSTERPMLLEESAGSVEIETPTAEEMAADFVDAAEPLDTTIDLDSPQIADAEETSLETAQVPEGVEMPDEQPTEPQLAAITLPTSESDPLDESAKHPASPEGEEQNDPFNEYIEATTTNDPGFDSYDVHDALEYDPEFRSAGVDTDPIGDPEFDATSIHAESVHGSAFDTDNAPVEGVDEEQSDPFTVDGSITYLSTSNPGVQTTTARPISKPKRRFFLWRLLARLFRRSSKTSL